MGGNSLNTITIKYQNKSNLAGLKNVLEKMNRPHHRSNILFHFQVFQGYSNSQNDKGRIMITGILDCLRLG